MPLDVATIGAAGKLLGGIGSIAGAFGKSGPSYTKQLKYQKDHQLGMARDMYKAHTKGAKRAGLHPLFALGSNVSIPAAQPVMTGQSNSGSRVGDALSGVGSAISGYAEHHAGKIAQERQTLEWQQHMINQYRQQEKLEAEKDFISAQAAATRHKMQQQDANVHPSKYIEVYNQFTGRTEYLPNPELGYELPESIGAAIYGRATMEDQRRYNSGKTSRPRGRNPR